ncbi:MAG: hypothetical protein DRR11_15455 [Gammaproteobacteria bacterium]|nr:MAG: hypothetical protein DRR11_15455 [Gammaproteobacteria bacterium]
MIKHIKRIAAALILVVSCTTASGERLIAELNGSGNQTTATFTVTAPWILDWRINSEFERMVSFDLDLLDGNTGVLKGSVVVRKSLGRGLEDGVRLFNESGKFRFRVNGSLVQWYLKVKQLTPAEAELYTPR